MNPLVQSAATDSSAGLAPSYSVRLAVDAADLRAAQALRFEVFNIELNEGLGASYETGLDVDAFDAVCDHLIVEDALSGQVVGTYRMQTGQRAAEALGYYSAREFDFHPFEGRRAEILELGRACIDRKHRSFSVLNLLWRGISDYAHQHGSRYLLGCSSLTSQDASIGALAYRRLARHLAPTPWQTDPLGPWTCSLDMVAQSGPRIPKLLSAYLGLGACICGPPAIDREFGTIDFLTWLDLESSAARWMRQRGRWTTPGSGT